MEMRSLGATGVELSVIGLGAWAMGGPWEYGWGPTDDDASIATIHRALDLGINWIDTAAAYGLGHAEDVIRRALKGRHERVFIATKCGMVWDYQGVVNNDLRPKSIRAEVEASLRRLGVDVIDLYQIHWPDPEEKAPLEESWGTMADLVKEGKVRFIGASNFDVEDMERCRPIHPLASLQPPYNMLRRGVEDAILPYCKQHNIGVIPYSPMASGLLTEGFDIEHTAPDDWRRRDFGEATLRRASAVVAKLRPLAERHNATVAQVAVAWVLRRPEVSSAIVGARRVWQVEQNAGAAAVRLTEADLGEIEAILSDAT